MPCTTSVGDAPGVDGGIRCAAPVIPPSSFKSFHGFRPRATFLLLVQEKSSQREEHPSFAPADILSARCVSAGWAFRQHILCWRKGRCIPAPAPAGLVIRPSPLHRGPGKAERASCAPRERALPRTQHPRTGRPLGSLGPLWSGRGLRLERCRCAAAATRHARRDADTDVGVFSECTGCAPGKPRKPARTLPAGRRQSAEAGWPLFWFVFSGQTEKMNSRPIGRESS